MFLRFDISFRWNVKHSTIEHPKCRGLSQTHLSKHSRRQHCHDVTGISSHISVQCGNLRNTHNAGNTMFTILTMRTILAIMTVRAAKSSASSKSCSGVAAWESHSVLDRSPNMYKDSPEMWVIVKSANLSYSSSSWWWSAYDLISWSTARKIGIWIGNRQRRRHLFFCKISRVTKLGSRQTNNTNGIELDPIHQK